MLIGVSGKENTGFSEMSGFPPGEAITYHADLAPEVENALKIVRDDFGSEISTVPIAVQSSHAHHGDYGLEFRERSFEDVTLNPSASSFQKLTTNNLVARVSFGMNPSNKREGKSQYTIFRNPNSLGRLHLNVFGSRQFLPEDFRENQGGERDGFLHNIERVHFSMRWIDGKFDGVWNDFGEFEKHLDSNYLNRPRFEKMRSTYMSSGKRSERVNGYFAKDPAVKNGSAREKAVSLDDVAEILGTRNNVLPANLTREEALKQFSKAFDSKNLEKVYNFYGYSGEDKKDFEDIGYASVLNVLSDFGDVSLSDERRIPKMDMIEGADYIFRKILPAMREYTLSK